MDPPSIIWTIGAHDCRLIMNAGMLTRRLSNKYGKNDSIKSGNVTELILVTRKHEKTRAKEAVATAAQHRACTLNMAAISMADMLKVRNMISNLSDKSVRPRTASMFRFSPSKGLNIQPRQSICAYMAAGCQDAPYRKSMTLWLFAARVIIPHSTMMAVTLM